MGSYFYIYQQLHISLEKLAGLTIMSNQVVLSKHALAARLPSSNIPLSVASPTGDLSSAEYVRELVHGAASYQVIPSTITPFNYNAEGVLLGVLPKTKNILLDLTLPFFNCGNDQEEGYYNGRYLIYNQRLIGVRLCCANRVDLSGQDSTFKKWPSRKVSSWKIPPSVLKFYKSSNFNERSFKREISVGDFIISFKNVRISLLFETQLKYKQRKLEDSTIGGAQIISIVNDTPRDKIMENRLGPTNYSAFSSLENQLKYFSRNFKKIVMYCGCRIAPLTELYLSNSFILHHELPQAIVQPHFLNLGGSMTLLCNVSLGPKDIAKTQPSEIRGINNLSVQERLFSVQKVNPGKERRFNAFGGKYNGPIPEQTKEILQKMHFWYIFNSINEGNRFIIPLPLSEFTKTILRQFQQILKYNGSAISSFIVFYKTEKDLDLAPNLLDSGIELYDSLSDLLEKLKQQKYFFYIDNPNRHEELCELAEKNHNIILCDRNLMREEELQKNKTIETIEQRIIDFADKIIQFGLYSLKKIIVENRHSSQPLNKDQLLLAITVHLNSRIRASYRSHPFFRFILSKNRIELEEALAEAEYQCREESKTSQNEQSRKVDESSSRMMNDNEESTQNSKQFFTRLDKFKKYFGNEKKMNQLQCHRCLKYVFKNFVNYCSLCRTGTCYFCFQTIKSRPSNPQGYKECLVCKKTCFCESCIQRKRRQAREKEKIQTSSEDIIGLSQIQPEKTLEELEEAKIEKSLEEDACQICQIEGREALHIKVLCSKCDQQGCFNCIRAKEKGDRKFVREWLCDNCKPPPPPPALRISQEMNVMPMIDEQAQLNTPYNSPIDERELSRPQKPQYNSNKNSRRRRSPSNSPSPTRNVNNLRSKRKSPSQQNSPKRKVNRARSPEQQPSPPKRKQRPRSPEGSISPKRGLNKSKQSVNQHPPSPKISKPKRPRSPSRSISPQRKRKPSRSRSRSNEKSKRNDSIEEKPQSSGKALWGKNISRVDQQRQFERGRGRGRGSYPNKSRIDNGSEENKSRQASEQDRKKRDEHVADILDNANDIDY